MPHLLLLFLIPLFSSIFLFALQRYSKQWIAVSLSLIPLCLLLYYHGTWIGSEFNANWFDALSIRFHLRVDTLSLIFLYLTAIVTPISLLAISDKIASPSFFYGLVLFLQALLIGFFTTQDLVVFTIFWEAMLLPLYFIINGWGGQHRQSAAYQFIIYLIAGSSLMVAAVLALYFTSSTFDLDQLSQTAESQAPWIFGVFALAFAVKTPLFPFHGWLPDAYYEAPTSGTILLSALLSKAGIYGFLRIGAGLFPQTLLEWSPLLLGLAIAGVFYGGFAAWMQNDFKRLIAYSSLSHVNFILAGIFAWNHISESGAILQAFNHGITITALFLSAGWLEERTGSTSIDFISGLAKYLPHLCWLTLFFVLSSVALPGLNNFIGEIMILWGVFIHHPWQASILAATVIISVMYMLRWMQKVYFEIPSPFQPSWIDIGKKEFAIALPLIAIILWIGIYPTPLLNRISPPTQHNVEKSR